MEDNKEKELSPYEYFQSVKDKIKEINNGYNPLLNLVK